MDRLVNDLLTLARLDEGVPMQLAPVELVSLVSDAVRTATAVGPDWPVQFWAATPLEVTGDKDRLRQVVDNLLANVRAHTPPGTATTVRLDQVGDDARIEVRDTGPGHADRTGPARLRTLLPRRSGSSPHEWRQRSRSLDRGRHRGGPRRHGLGHLCSRPGHDGHGAAPDDPFRAGGTRVRKSRVGESRVRRPRARGHRSCTAACSRTRRLRRPRTARPERRRRRPRSRMDPSCPPSLPSAPIPPGTPPPAASAAAAEPHAYPASPPDAAT